MSQSPVANKALKLADSHRLTLDAQDTRALALRLLRTYTATNRGQRAVEVDSVGSGTDITLGEVVDKVGNMDIHGAGSNATGILAVEATGSLQQRLLLVIAVAYLSKLVARTLGSCSRTATRGILFAIAVTFMFVVLCCCSLLILVHSLTAHSPSKST